MNNKETKITETTKTETTKTIETTENSETTSAANIKNAIEIYGIYSSEWEHRDSILWKQIYWYFFASLIVMMIPFMDQWGLTLSDKIPHFVFPVVGLIMTLAFFVVSQGYIARMKALNETMKEIRAEFPSVLQRKTVEDIKKGCWGKILNLYMTSIITITMFIGLLGIGITLLVFSLIS